MIPSRDKEIGTLMLFTLGFRPFFLLAGLWAVVGMGAWLVFLWWGVLPPTAFAPGVWHAHEMLFGYVVAAVAGLLIMALSAIVSGRNWRNLPVAAAIALLLAANGMSHAGAMGMEKLGDAGLRLAIAVIIMLISLIGGRIVPNFTANWLKERDKSHRSPPFSSIDKAALIISVLALGPG